MIRAVVRWLRHPLSTAESWLSVEQAHEVGRRLAPHLGAGLPRFEPRTVSVTLVVAPEFIDNTAAILTAAVREVRQRAGVNIRPGSAVIRNKPFGRVEVSWLVSDCERATYREMWCVVHDARFIVGQSACLAVQEGENEGWPTLAYDGDEILTELRATLRYRAVEEWLDGSTPNTVLVKPFAEYGYDVAKAELRAALAEAPSEASDVSIDGNAGGEAGIRTQGG